MDLFRRELAPIGERGWAEIESRAREVLTSNLFCRQFLEVEGPYGFDYNAYPLGSLNNLKNPPDALGWGVRAVLPLVEVRAPFKLSLWELDNLYRGNFVVDFSSMERAALELAEFEDRAILKGLDEACIAGLERLAPVRMPIEGTPQSLTRQLFKAMGAMISKGVKGPYVLVVNPALWAEAFSKSTESLMELAEDAGVSEVVLCPRLEKGILLSPSSENMRIVLGQDVTIGYCCSSETEVHLYFTETFTFHVANPDAMVLFE